MEYRINKDGEIFTEQEYIESIQMIFYSAPEWKDLSSIEIKDGKREEIQEKLRYIYTPINLHSYSFCIIDYSNTFTKDPTRLLKLNITKNDGIQNDK